jgi:hypothetical protein
MTVSKRERQLDQEAQRAWIQLNLDSLASLAQFAFAESGRGAIVVRKEHPQQRKATEAWYIAESFLSAHGLGWPDGWTQERVHTYEPASEFVIIFDHGDRTDVHRIVYLN